MIQIVLRNNIHNDVDIRKSEIGIKNDNLLPHLRICNTHIRCNVSLPYSALAAGYCNNPRLLRRIMSNVGIVSRFMYFFH